MSTESFHVSAPQMVDSTAWPYRPVPWLFDYYMRAHVRAFACLLARSLATPAYAAFVNSGTLYVASPVTATPMAKYSPCYSGSLSLDGSVLIGLTTASGSVQRAMWTFSPPTVRGLLWNLQRSAALPFPMALRVWCCQWAFRSHFGTTPTV